MKLIVATHNKGKTKEFRALFAPFYDEIADLNDLNVGGEADETGSTFSENAKIKAVFASEFAQDCDIISDDSGLCVEALKGEPGVFSARYAGLGATDADNRKKLLKALEGEQNRKAYFESCLYMLRQNKKDLTATGRTEGTITQEERGEKNFGYDSIFYSPELNMTFGEAEMLLKNTVSHRARAITAIVEQLKKEKN